jgi:hypothetical protein
MKPRWRRGEYPSRLKGDDDRRSFPPYVEKENAPHALQVQLQTLGHAGFAPGRGAVQDSVISAFGGAGEATSSRWPFFRE